MKSLEIVCVVAFTAAVAGGAYAYTKWDQWTVWPELRKPVLATLKDPDSALFRNQFVGRRALCGEVNARNGMGGYAGYSRFIGGGERFVLEGASTRTWFTGSDDLHRLTLAMEKEAFLIQSLKRRVTQEEVQAALFNDLWKEYCEGIV